MNKIQHNLNQASGFSLIEILITILVLSVGMLGIAGMQTSSLRLSSEAHLRSQATQLTYDLLARIRANPQADYTIANPGNVDCINTACDSDEIRDFDLTFWNNDLITTFPNAEYTVNTVDVDGVNYVQITITWYERVEGLSERNTNRNPQIDVIPRPYTITARI